MSLLGRLNWWVPAWLDRALPTVRAEISETDLPDLPQRSPATTVSGTSPAAYAEAPLPQRITSIGQREDADEIQPSSVGAR
jgi:RND superfamily putative drug exporter